MLISSRNLEISYWVEIPWVKGIHNTRPDPAQKEFGNVPCSTL